MSDPIYAIGDVHGHADKLDAALDKIARDSGGRAARVVFLGDLIDRGPDSRGVVERLVAGLAAGRDWIALKGNHDRFLTRFLDDPHRPEERPKGAIHWLDARLGGRETLRSYGIDAGEGRRLGDIHADALEAIPEAHVAFLRAMPLMHHTDRHLFVHAGLRPGVALSAQTEDDLLWIRQEFLTDTRDHGFLVFHGHTPVAAPQHYGNRVNLDSGAGHGQALTAAVIEDSDVHVLTHTGRVKL